MPAAKISAGIISVRAAIDLTKAMVGVRDDKLIATKTNELRFKRPSVPFVLATDRLQEYHVRGKSSRAF
jgi:hypothetical protein